MLMDVLRSNSDEIKALGHQFGAKHIRVFGSVARGDERPDSDIDILVNFPRGYDLFNQRMPLTEKLTDLLNQTVNLTPEHELNRHIREHVLTEAVDI
ncbi:MAG: nucleotidyltransferase [Gammaproteobacteria bacterium]|nr:MAG: nucleotidyltransferase [Gammaproteobacteria bacterium]